LIFLRLLSGFLVFFPLLANAGWWTPADDEKLRHSIQQLADQQCLSVPVTTWPLAWTDLSALDHADLPEHCRNAARRYVLDERARATGSGPRYGVTLSGANEPMLWRGFAASPRERAMVSASVGLSSTRFDARLDASFADSEQDKGRLDGSYMAAAMGNWALGVGAVDRWWGPGWQSSLVLSHNARPAPAVFISRMESTPFQSRWLSWIGHWQANIFVAQLEHQRDPARSQLIGMRASFKPASSLEIGLSRTIQWAGEGRPKGADTFFYALVGRDNAESSGFASNQDDPSDQMAGFDVRYSRLLGENTLALYGQMIGEDEAGMMPAKYIYLAGAELGSHIGRGSQRWVLEASNTLVGAWLSEKLPGVAYEHMNYVTGLRYKSRNMGSTWERDAEVLVLAFRQYFANQHELGITLAHANLNQEGVVRPGSLSPVPPLALASEATRTDVIGLSYRLPLAWGRFTLAAQHSTKNVPMVAGLPERSTVSASWEYRPARY